MSLLSNDHQDKTIDKHIKVVKNTGRFQVKKIDDKDLAFFLNETWQWVTESMDHNLTFCATQLIWLTGCPGCGKSSICKQLLKDYQLNDNSLIDTSKLAYQTLCENNQNLDMGKQYEKVINTLVNRCYQEKRIIIDGFLRHPQHASIMCFLFDQLYNFNNNIEFIILFVDVSANTSVERQLKRGRALINQKNAIKYDINNRNNINTNTNTTRNSNNNNSNDANNSDDDIDNIDNIDGKQEKKDENGNVKSEEKQTSENNVKNNVETGNPHVLLKTSDLDEASALERYKKYEWKLQRFLTKMNQINYFTFNLIDGNISVDQVYKSVEKEIKYQSQSYNNYNNYNYYNENHQQSSNSNSRRSQKQEKRHYTNQNRNYGRNRDRGNRGSRDFGGYDNRSSRNHYGKNNYDEYQDNGNYYQHSNTYKNENHYNRNDRNENQHQRRQNRGLSHQYSRQNSRQYQASGQDYNHCYNFDDYDNYNYHRKPHQKWTK